tara:strand:- start:5834 stop:6865 length:1032 start_codon:yes stop_codon:yes gene_type:complete
MNFKLQNYEMVEDRLKRFWAKCPNGRIDTEVVNVLMDGAMIMVKAYLYENKEDEKPVATGLAMDWKGKDSGATKTNWMETSETSAIGRAIANSRYQDPKAQRPSREEMQIALGRRNNTQTKAPTKVEKQEEFDLPDPIENTPQDLIEEETLKEVEELNATETIDGWLDNVKKEYHKKMVALNPNIDKNDTRMHLNKAFIEKQTLEKGRKKFQDGVDHWNKMVKTKPYDIEDREKGDINVNEIDLVSSKDLPPVVDEILENMGAVEVDKFEEFPNIVKNTTYKNPGLKASQKQKELVLKCCNYRNISTDRLNQYLKQEFESSLENLTIQQASWLIDGFFGEKKR